jgi:hypothetical protein
MKTTNIDRHLIPKPGLRVVDPATGKALPAGGAAVHGHEIYWLRRLADGDVTEGSAEPNDRSVTTRTRRSTNRAEAPAAAKASQE